MLDKASIFAAAQAYKPAVVPVSIPEFSQTWYVKEFSLPEDQHWNQEANEHAKIGQALAWFAACAVCDETGKRLFDDLDTKTLHTLPLVVLRRVWFAGAKLNCLTREFFEDVEKKFAATVSGDSSSTSS